MGLDDAVAREHGAAIARDAAHAVRRQENASRFIAMQAQLLRIAMEAVEYCRSTDRPQTAGFFSVEQTRIHGSPNWEYDLVTRLWDFPPFVLDAEGTVYIHPACESPVPMHVYIYDDKIRAAQQAAMARQGVSALYTHAQLLRFPEDPGRRISESDPPSTLWVNQAGQIWRNHATRPLEDEVAAALVARYGRVG